MKIASLLLNIYWTDKSTPFIFWRLRGARKTELCMKIEEMEGKAMKVHVTGRLYIMCGGQWRGRGGERSR